MQARSRFQMPATLNRALRVLALISRDLEPLDHRRKLVVCIGSPAVCNMAEPQPRGYSALWRPWVDAIGAASRANVGVCAAMPTAPGAVRFLGGGLAEITGGTAFSNTGSSTRSSMGWGRRRATITCSDPGRPSNQDRIRCIRLM